jgi:hypothetical protein
MKIYATCRFTPYDDFLVDHFFEYYLSKGVNVFLINFNCKLSDEKTLNAFIEKTLSEYGQYIKYNVGPNGINVPETSNIDMLKKLVKEHTNVDEDFVLPTDSDEFHDLTINKLSQETFNTFVDIANAMNTNNIDCISGCTNERITSDGSIQQLIENVNIFEQFPEFNNNLFCMPKISIIRAKYYHCLGVGHHYIDNKLIQANNIIILNGSRTNHFKWNLQGKQRLENWNKVFNDEKYTGWKDANKYKNMLDVFEKNLKTYGT